MAADTGKRIARRAGAHTAQRGGAAPVCRRRPSARAGAAIGAGALAALTLKPIPVADVLQNQHTSAFDYLYTAYVQYCKVSKVKPATPPARGSHGNRLKWLMGRMAAVLKKQHKQVQLMPMYCDKEGENKQPYYFNAYCYHETTGHSLNLYPLQYLQYLQQTDNPLYEPLLCVYGWLINRAGISTYRSNQHYDYVINMALEQAQDMEYEEEYEQCRQLIENYYDYRQLPHAKSLLHLCIANADQYKPGSAAFAKLVKGHIALDGPLATWLLRGSELMADKDLLPIDNFQNNDDFEYDDGLSIQINEMFTINWGGKHDALCQQFEEVVNATWQEYGEYGPQSYLKINGKCTRQYRFNPWYNGFNDWACQGSVMLNHRLKETCYPTKKDSNDGDEHN